MRFSGCCTDDSKTNDDPNQLYNNQKIAKLKDFAYTWSLVTTSTRAPCVDFNFFSQSVGGALVGRRKTSILIRRSRRRWRTTQLHPFTSITATAAAAACSLIPGLEAFAAAVESGASEAAAEVPSAIEAMVSGHFRARTSLREEEEMRGEGGEGKGRGGISPSGRSNRGGGDESLFSLQSLPPFLQLH